MSCSNDSSARINHTYMQSQLQSQTPSHASNTKGGGPAGDAHSHGAGASSASNGGLREREEVKKEAFSVALSGHKGPVNGACFSLSCRGGRRGDNSRGAQRPTAGASSLEGQGQEDLVLTWSAADRTVKMWMTSRADPVLSFEEASNAAAGQDNGGFMSGGDLIDASFFRRDQLVTVTTKKTLSLFKYDLSDYTDRVNDLKRLSAEGAKKRIFTYYGAANSGSSMSAGEDGPSDGARAFSSSPSYSPSSSSSSSSASYVTLQCSFSAVATANLHISDFILLAGNGLSASATSRFVDILDMNKAVVARRLLSPHSKAIHRLVLYDYSHSTFTDSFKPSFLSSDTPFSPTNVFLSAATDSTILLWDLRVKDPVGHMNAHVARTFGVGACFSPCMRYVATGSEDKCAYMYDLRVGKHGGSVVKKIRTVGANADVVSDVCFHPTKNRVYLASLNGSISAYAGP